MRMLEYEVAWNWRVEAEKRSGTLVDLVLDIFYLIGTHGVIPPLVVLNQVLRSGSSGGGMSPGTEWKPFEIAEDEYTELVDALLQLDPKEAKQKHPYVSFTKITIDEELNQCLYHFDWLQQLVDKYDPPTEPRYKPLPEYEAWLRQSAIERYEADRKRLHPTEDN